MTEQLSWRALNDQLYRMSEREVEEMLLREMKESKRTTIAVRLHQRLTALRATRERQELRRALG